MKFPKLRQTRQSVQTQSVFGGYNHNPRIGDGEFYDMRNLSSDSYPLLAPRKVRGVEPVTEAAQGQIYGIAVNNGLCYVKGSSFVLPDGSVVEMGLSQGEKKLVAMGAYVIILPDKKWINTVNGGEYGDIEWEYQASRVSLWVCRRDGSPIVFVSGTDRPITPSGGSYWIDDTGDTPVLKKWDSESGLWIEETSYLRLRLEGSHKFKKGDALLGPEIRTEFEAPAGLKRFLCIPKDPVVLDVIDGDLIVNGFSGYGLLVNSCTAQVDIHWQRRMPDMDFVIESGNRLWGCKFGQTENGFVNELYASALGDFTNWSRFQGISTDIYRASVGADGPFTGAVNYLGRPLFFKESCMLRVFGDQPSGFRIQDTPCQGVQKGCAGSLAVVNNMLFYKAWSGVYGYDGSLPAPVGAALGDRPCRTAVAGGIGRKYYLSMEEEAGRQLYVYDTGRGLWHREDDPGTLAFATGENSLYCLPETRDRILLMTGGGQPAEDTVAWMAQTGPLGLTDPETKYISRLLLRLTVEPEAVVRVSVRYDRSPRWEHLYTLRGSQLRSFTLPIRPKRCDHMYLRLEGMGGMQVYSLTRIWEEGGDL